MASHREPRLVRTQGELERLAKVFGCCRECGTPLDLMQIEPPGKPVTAVVWCAGCNRQRHSSG
jgi:hypothetical protein